MNDAEPYRSMEEVEKGKKRHPSAADVVRVATGAGRRLGGAALPRMETVVGTVRGLLSGRTARGPW